METASASSRPIVIVNPTANRGDIQRHRAALLRQLAPADAEYIETTKRGEAGALARNAANAGRSIILVGGDGTINEVAGGILSAGKRVPLGIVPAGSGNDFAWNTLKLPHDVDAAVTIALRGKLVAADAGIVNDRYTLY